MKFQNPRIHRLKVNRRTHTHTHTHTDRQAESNMPFQLFQSWGHKNTVSGHNYSPPLENSIDLHVFSCLQKKIFCFSWSTYFYVFGVI